MRPAHVFHLLCTWSKPGALKQAQPGQGLLFDNISANKSSDSTQVPMNQVIGRAIQKVCGTEKTRRRLSE